MLTIASVLEGQIGKYPHFLETLSSELYFSGSRITVTQRELSMNYFLESTRFPLWLIKDILELYPPKATYLIPYYLSRNKHLSLAERLEFGRQFLIEFTSHADFDGGGNAEIDFTKYYQAAELIFNLFPVVLQSLQESLVNSPHRILKYIGNILRGYRPTLPFTFSGNSFAELIQNYLGTVVKYTTLDEFYSLLENQYPLPLSKHLTDIITHLPSLDTSEFIRFFERLKRDYNNAHMTRWPLDWIKALIMHKDFNNHWFSKCSGSRFSVSVLRCICMCREDLLTLEVQNSMISVFRRKYPYAHGNIGIFFQAFAKLYTAENFPDFIDISQLNVDLRCTFLEYLPFTSHHTTITAKWFSEPHEMRKGHRYLVSNPCYPSSELEQIIIEDKLMPVWMIARGHYHLDKLWLSVLDRLSGPQLRHLIDQPISSRLFEAILTKQEFPSDHALQQNPHLSLYSFQRCAPQKLIEHAFVQKLVTFSSYENFLAIQLDIESNHRLLRQLHTVFSDLEWELHRQVIEIVLCDEELYWRRYSRISEHER